MNTQTILTIAAKHSAYADSRVCVRGQDDIVAFAKEVMQLAAQPVLTRTTINAEDLRRHQDLGLPLHGVVEINPGPLSKPLFDPATARSITKTAQDNMRAFAMLLGMTDEQCDDMAGMPDEAAST